MNYTDTQLKQALPKMLPKCIYENGELYIFDADFAGLGGHRQVRDTELLHLCWMVEEILPCNEQFECYEILKGLIWASWQKRVEALAKVKGIEIFNVHASVN